MCVYIYIYIYVSCFLALTAAGRSSQLASRPLLPPVAPGLLCHAGYSQCWILGPYSGWISDSIWGCRMVLGSIKCAHTQTNTSLYIDIHTEIYAYTYVYIQQFKLLLVLCIHTPDSCRSMACHANAMSVISSRAMPCPAHAVPCPAMPCHVMSCMHVCEHAGAARSVVAYHRLD